MPSLRLLVLIFLSLVVTLCAGQAPLPDLFDATVVELQQGLDMGNFTSVALVKVCNLVDPSSSIQKSDANV